MGDLLRRNEVIVKNAFIGVCRFTKHVSLGNMINFLLTELCAMKILYVRSVSTMSKGLSLDLY